MAAMAAASLSGTGVSDESFDAAGVVSVDPFLGGVETVTTESDDLDCPLDVSSKDL